MVITNILNWDNFPVNKQSQQDLGFKKSIIKELLKLEISMRNTPSERMFEMIPVNFMWGDQSYESKEMMKKLIKDVSDGILTNQDLLRRYFSLATNKDLLLDINDSQFVQIYLNNDDYLKKIIEVILKSPLLVFEQNINEITKANTGFVSDGREIVYGFNFSENLGKIITKLCGEISDNREIITNLKNKLKDIISSLNTSNENSVIMNFKHSLEILVNQMEFYLGNKLFGLPL